MEKFSKISENLSADDRKNIQKVFNVVEDKMKDYFYKGKPEFKYSISRIDGKEHIHYNFYIKDSVTTQTPSDWVETAKKLTTEVQKHFKRIDDQGLEPLMFSNNWNDVSSIVLSFGEIDFENSEIVKSVSAINKFKL